VTEGSTFAWHDRRIRWSGAGLPPVVEAAPNDRHLIFRWRVPASVDAKRFAVSGFLGYAPVPGVATTASGTSRWLLAGVVAATTLALLALGVGARRTRRRTP
jgi:hypothetical protein